MARTWQDTFLLFSFQLELRSNYCIRGITFFLLFLSQKNSYSDKMLCISAKICIQTCWLLIVAKVLDQTDQILPKNQKSIQGKIQEASRKYPYENCCFQMPQKPKAKCVLENAYLLSLWSFCTIKSFFIHATSFLRPNILDFSIAPLVRNDRASIEVQTRNIQGANTKISFSAGFGQQKWAEWAVCMPKLLKIFFCYPTKVR